MAEFCHASNLRIFANAINLVEVIVLLAKYKEEGVVLFPEVYVSTDIGALCAMLPEGERLPLGSTRADAFGIAHAIKKCAPLASGGWLVYIEDKSPNLEFGVFRGANNPISVLADTVLLEPNDDVRVVKIFQVAEDCVAVLCNSGDRHFIFLNHRREDSPPPLQHLDNLIAKVCNHVPPDLKDPSLAFLKRILYNALRVSHGCLIAVTDRKRPPRQLFNDGISLASPIDLPSLIHQLLRNELPPSSVTSKATLLEGMLNSDGIILFDDRAEILGYNYFVRAKPTANESGGARRRAFATLARYVGKGLTAAFMQSQDGWSDFKGTPHD